MTLAAAEAADFASFRSEARRLLAAGVPPEDVVWSDGRQASLFGHEAPAPERPRSAAPGPALRLPGAVVARLDAAASHGDPGRWAVLYRLVWKLARHGPAALGDPLDPDVARLAIYERQVREAEHDMHAFVRFRRRVDPDGLEHRVAYYEPAQPVLRRVAPFFVRRFPSDRWTILTPAASVTWDGVGLVFAAGAPRSAAPAEDETDALFLAYYASVYNPARTNVPALARHLPRATLRQLPEGALVVPLAQGAEARVAGLRPEPAPSASAALVPERPTLAALDAAARGCRACPLGASATQTVFGEGAPRADLFVVGEQPGDEEDLAGRPFVGPAGRLLDTLLAEAGLARERAYVTNAVKHFKFLPRGKRRLHQRPSAAEVDACKGWLFAELALVKPRVVLCLGATAAQAFAGPGFRVQRDRGKPTSTPWAPWWMATYHPSALLRAEGPARGALEAAVRADLALVREELGRVAG